jgi:rubrerythrin
MEVVMNQWSRLIQQEEEHLATLRACLSMHGPKHIQASLEQRIKFTEWRLRKLRAAA